MLDKIYITDNGVEEAYTLVYTFNQDGNNYMVVTKTGEDYYVFGYDNDYVYPIDDDDELDELENYINFNILEDVGKGPKDHHG